MGKLKLDISMSLDGFVAGPNATLEEPLGVGGEQLHEWIFGLKAWREPHGLEGGEEGPDDDVVAPGRPTSCTRRRPVTSRRRTPIQPGLAARPHGRSGRASRTSTGITSSSPSAVPRPTTLQPEW